MNDYVMDSVDYTLLKDTCGYDLLFKYIDNAGIFIVILIFGYFKFCNSYNCLLHILCL